MAVFIAGVVVLAMAVAVAVVVAVAVALSLSLSLSVAGISRGNCSGREGATRDGSERRVGVVYVNIVEFCARRRAEKAEQIDQTVRGQTKPNQTRERLVEFAEIAEIAKIAENAEIAEIARVWASPRRSTQNTKTKKSSAAYLFLPQRTAYCAAHPSSGTLRPLRQERALSLAVSLLRGSLSLAVLSQRSARV